MKVVFFFAQGSSRYHCGFWWAVVYHFQPFAQLLPMVLIGVLMRGVHWVVNQFQRVARLLPMVLTGVLVRREHIVCNGHREATFSNTSSGSPIVSQQVLWTG